LSLFFYISIMTKKPILNWYDPVSYFQMRMKQPLWWSEDFQSEYDWWLYYFSSKNNKELFDKNPKNYAPAYRWYCATALSEWKLVPANPKNYMIYNGILYVFYSNRFGVNTFPQWNRNRDGRIEQANYEWEQKKGK